MSDIRKALMEVTKEIKALPIIIFNAIAVMLTLWLILWGRKNLNINAITVGTLIGIMALLSIIAAIALINNFKSKAESSEDYYDNNIRIPNVMLVAGFITAAIMIKISSSFSILSVLGKMDIASVLATFRNNLPQLYDFFITSVLLPVVEENLWMLVIPIMVFLVMAGIGRKFEFFNNQYFQLAVAIIVSGWTFMEFHVGQASIEFKIAAIIFRSFTIIILWGDTFFNLIPGVNVMPSFNYGFHIGNNWILQSGFLGGLAILSTSIYGWLFMLFMLLIVVSALDYFHDLIKKFSGDKYEITILIYGVIIIVTIFLIIRSVF